MGNIKFLIRSLKHYGKQHLAVFLAIMISAAVLTGALIVGDSVRLSLRKNVHLRLGSIEMVLSAGDRFITLKTADRFFNETRIKAAAVLNSQGMAVNSLENLRKNRVEIWGIDDQFWQFSDNNYDINYGEAVISESLAEELKLEKDDRILLRIKKTGLIPLNAPFTSDEDPSVSLRLKIIAIAERENLGGFSLRNEQATAFNVFVNREQLADRLDLKAYCNLILCEQADREELDMTFANVWSLNDAAIQINESEDSSKLELISDRVFIDNAVINSVDQLGFKDKKALTYFVNELNYQNKQTPYSFVGGIENESIHKDHIVINSWLADDLQVGTGDSIQLKYFVIGPLRRLVEKEKTFIVQNVLSIDHPLFSRDLMPDFPGLSTAGNCSDWDAGIPIDLEKIRDKDEDYWDEYKGTPKALILLDHAVELWGNPYGNYTSVKFTEITSKEDLSGKILEVLKPLDFGFQFINVKEAGNSAANNGVDFGGLFLSLSFFVIASALLLLILVLRLQMENRIGETGVLVSLGFPIKKIIWLRWYETIPLIIAGSILGAVLGIAYNLLLIKGLNTVWNQAVHTSILEAFVVPSTIITGFIISIVLSGFVIWFTVRKQLKKSVISLIRDQKAGRKWKLSSLWSGVVLITLALIMSFYSVASSIENSSSTVLTAGFLLLIGLVCILQWRWNNNSRTTQLNSLLRLAYRNIKRNLNRSIAVVILLSLGTFTVIITGANRKTFDRTESKRQSGTGGFLYWAETSIPLLYDLNTEEGKKELGLDQQTVLDSSLFLQFRSKPGDDASCLNLNQVQQPQILGVNAHLLDSLNAFSFAKQLEERENPWLTLDDQDNEFVIPAIADQTVIQWGLIKKIGDTLQYFNEEGRLIKLVLVGGLDASIFQGNILISEDHFQKHYPSAAGSSFMLIDAPLNKKEEIKQLLTNDLSDFGIELTETSARLAQFYSVTNTYLSIFMILGGLGVIIGTIGLGIMLLRNMIDRKNELVLLNSIGFANSQVSKIIIIENLVLVFWGMMIGIVSAMVGILPSFLSKAFSIPGNFLIWIVVLVFLSAILWIYISAKIVVKKI